MKNILKLIGIIAIVLIIGFSFVTCDDGENGDGNGSGNSSDNNTGNGNGNDNSSGNSNGGNTATKPSTPTGVTARSLSADTIRVSWSAVSGATSYKVYYSSYSGQENPSLTTTVTTTSYERTSLVSDSTYYFKVSAVNSDGEGTASSVVSAKTNKFGTPGIPTGVTAAPLSSSSIQITWLSPSGIDKPTGYKIYRSTVATGTFPSIANTSSLTYTDTGLNASTTYYYFVVATNSNGDGSVSSTASATTTASSSGGTSPTTVPSAPTGVTATAASSSSITVSWSSVSGATGYYVYRSSTAAGTYTQAGSSTSTSYTNTGLSANTTYYYKVAAYNSAGTGSQSSYASATTQSSSSGGGTYGSVKIVNNSSRTISNFTLYQQGYDLIGGTGFYLFNATIQAGESATWTNAPPGSYVRIGSQTYSGYKVDKTISFTVTTGQTTTVTISSSDVVSN